MLLLTDSYFANINADFAEPKASLFAKVTGAAVLGLIHWFLVISVGKRSTAHHHTIPWPFMCQIPNSVNKKIYKSRIKRFFFFFPRKT